MNGKPSANPYRKACEELEELIIMLRFSNTNPLGPKEKEEAHTVLKEAEVLAERHIPNDHEMCRRTIWHSRSKNTWQEVTAYLYYLHARLTSKAYVNDLKELPDTTVSAPGGAYPRTMH